MNLLQVVNKVYYLQFFYTREVMKLYRIMVLSVLLTSSIGQELLAKEVPTSFQSVFYALPIHKQKQVLVSYKKKKKRLLQAYARMPYWVHWYIDLGTYKIESAFVGGVLLVALLWVFVAMLETNFSIIEHQ